MCFSGIFSRPSQDHKNLDFWLNSCNVSSKPPFLYFPSKLNKKAKIWYVHSTVVSINFYRYYLLIEKKSTVKLRFVVFHKWNNSLTGTKSKS